MKMAFIPHVFVLVFFVPQTITVIVIEPKNALYRHHDKVALCGNFKQYLYNYLAVIKISSSLVKSQSACSLKCVDEPKCYSWNIAAYPDSSGLYLCELLPTDKYTAKTKFHPNVTFHHFSPSVSRIVS